MSAIWGWAHEAEQPEKCMRMTPASPAACPPSAPPAVSCASRVRAHFTARSLVSTTAKRQNSEPVQATTPRSKGPGKGEYVCISGSASRSSSRSSGTPERMKFWSVPIAHRAVAVGLGQAGRLDEIDAVHAAHRDRAADVDQAGLLLGVDADVVAPEGVGQLAARRLEGELRALVEGGAEALGAELLGQVAHAGQAAVLPVAQLAEDLGHAAAQLDRLVGPDEEVDVRRHPLAVGEPAADEHVEPDGAVAVLGRPQADVVDLDPGAVLEAAR